MPDRLPANRNSLTTEALVSDETSFSTAASLFHCVVDTFTFRLVGLLPAVANMFLVFYCLMYPFIFFPLLRTLGKDTQ